MNQLLNQQIQMLANLKEIELLLRNKLNKNEPKPKNRLRVMCGGLDKSPVEKVDDHLSNEFRAFLEKERAEMGETT